MDNDNQTSAATEETRTSTGFEPKVLAYCCTFCAYSAADLAGSMRLQYPTNVRVVKIQCTGKMEPILILKALEQGADAVMVCGCAFGDCHFVEGNVRGKRWVKYTKQLLAESGLEPERIEFFHVPASAGPRFAEVVEEMTERARKLGPNPLARGREEGDAT